MATLGGRKSTVEGTRKRICSCRCSCNLPKVEVGNRGACPLVSLMAALFLFLIRLPQFWNATPCFYKLVSPHEGCRSRRKWNAELGNVRSAPGLKRKVDVSHAFTTYTLPSPYRSYPSFRHSWKCSPLNLRCCSSNFGNKKWPLIWVSMVVSSPRLILVIMT